MARPWERKSQPLLASIVEFVLLGDLPKESGAATSQTSSASGSCAAPANDDDYNDGDDDDDGKPQK